MSTAGISVQTTTCAAGDPLFSAFDIAKFLASMAASKPVDSPYTKQVAEYATWLDKENALAHFTLGNIAMAAKDWRAAFVHFLEAWLIDAKPPEALSLSLCKDHMGDPEDAIWWAEKAAKMHPQYVEAYLQQYGVNRQLVDGKARECIEKGIKHCGEDPRLVVALAELDLLEGKWETGWQRYESRATRLQLCGFMNEYPEWQGESLKGKTIVVLREQGLGDCVMMCRYHDVLRGMGAKVLLFTYEQLALLMIKQGAHEVYTAPEDVGTYDYWIGDASLPYRLGAVFGGPSYMDTPYISPEWNRTVGYSKLIENYKGLRVGLCWRGNPKHTSDRFRSIPFEAIKPLLDVKGNVRFYSFTGDDKESGLLNMLDYVHDVADTAAAINAMDMVITCDTLVGHLAGAMGKPVWVLLGTPWDWRWGLKGDSTPWYKSMTLFRNTSPRQWEAVIDEVVKKLNPSINPDKVVPRIAPGIEETESSVVTEAPATEGPVDARFGHDLTVADVCRYGNMFWPDNDRWVGRSLDLYGEFSESEVAMLRQVLKPGSIIIEAGAEIGGVTVGLADAVGERGIVVAFEPQPHYFDYLFENAKMRRIYPINAALGAEDGFLDIACVEKCKVFAHGMKQDAPDKFQARKVSIDSFCFDADFLSNHDKVALIKVDVDGMEHEILKGAEKTIDRCRPVLYVEYDKPDEYREMIPWIHGKGYRIYEHQARLYNKDNFKANPVNVFGRTVSLMLLCIPNERYDLTKQTIKCDDLKLVRVTEKK